jgi:hypothetical protein
MGVKAGESTVDRTEYTTTDDLYHDYCLYQYKPLSDPAGKLRSANLLYRSFEEHGMDDRAYDIVEAIRTAIGVNQTVWGLKRAGNLYAWELYFYDYRRRERERSMTRVLDSLKPFIACDVPINENDYYFMFSLDLDNNMVGGAASLDEIHMYVGNTASNVSSGMSYSLTSEGRKLENFYFFFDPKKDRDEVVAKVACSAHIDTTLVSLDSILWPELRDCRTICVANKQQSDCAYFSGINVDQFLFFLKRMNYPNTLISYVEGNRHSLDHLLYDVGIDYRMEGDDLMILKSGYYGTF